MFSVSTGKIDITPSVGYPLAGYGVDAPRLATGTNRPLYARCTIIYDGAVPHVVVTADVLGFRRDTHQQIRTAVTGLGVPSEDFVLTATHTHNGPVLTEGLDPFIAYDLENLTSVGTYTAWLVATITTLVAQTKAAPSTPCTLDYAVLEAGFSFNREDLPYVETDVPCLVARAGDGTPRAVLFGYGAHPVAGGTQTVFDGDYPVPAIEAIEGRWPGCFAQFMTGPAGDQNPNAAGSFDDVDTFGNELGTTIVDAIATAGRSLTGPMTAGYGEVTLPLDVSLTAGNVAAVRAEYLARSENPAIAGYERRHAFSMTQLIDTTPLADLEKSIPLPVQRWTIGGAEKLVLLFCGGEVVSGFAVVIRQENGGSDGVWFLAYSNEIPCYIPSDELLQKSTYAGGWDPDYPGIASASMAVYDHWAHFLRGSAGVDGVEQIFLAHLRQVMAAA
ncbi:hypothetical protein [Leifsonia sp. P73]|uniref:hypothetical protein n=1 Tax=Leifsonia sp. P73 TaxID=3423959 RepID=UPI003DA5F096